jgi:hypothetical protein
MKARTSMATLMAIAVTIAACGGDDAATTTTGVGNAAGVTQAAEAETTTTTEAPTTTTTTEAPTTTQAAVGADCLVGTWELDSEAFIEQIFAAADETGFEDLGEVTVSHGGGSFVVTMNADGSYVGDRDNWQIRLSAAEGTFVTTLNGEEAGTWSTEGDELTVTSESSSLQVSFAAEVDGVLQELPFGGPETVASRELGGTGPFTCDDDTLQVMFEGGTSTFARR